jgi:L-threonylcarbamoyladenylate synthase
MDRNQQMNPKLLRPTDENLSKSAHNLLSGNLVAFPTETVYGLGASATDEKGIKRIYEAKGRPKDHPLIVHISNISKLEIWAREIPDFAWNLAKELWPGPMTLILKRSELAKDFITGGQDTVGLRIPNNKIAFELLSEFENIGGFGVAAPSANRFGAVSPTSAKHVLDELENYLDLSDIVLDGGNSEIGIESTIIDCTSLDPIILRPGAVILDQIDLIAKVNKSEFDLPNNVKFSGSFDSHYSPKAKVLLNIQPTSRDGFIAMNEIATPNSAVRLFSPKNVDEYAAGLYASLRKGDELKLSRIVVVTPSNIGIGLAINDRLKKAAKK